MNKEQSRPRIGPDASGPPRSHNHNHNHNHFPPVSLFALLTAVMSCLGLASQPSAAMEAAFLDPPQGPASGPALQGGRAAGRPVTINPRLRHLLSVKLTVAPGEILTAERTRLEPAPGGGFIWVGRLDDEPLSEVVLVSHRGRSSGHISRPLLEGTSLHTIRPVQGGFSVLEALEPDDIPGGCEALPPPSLPKARLPLSPRRNVALSSAGFPSATAGNPAGVDLLVVYTPATTARYGDAAGVEALILESVASANTAYVDSGVHATVSLVHAAEVAYVETYDMGTALARLANPADGFMDDVQGLREAHAADLVVLLDQDSNYCGIAYQMSVVDTSFAPNAFSVVNSGCIPAFSLTHEMGHNMGSHHDRDNAFTPAAYSYSYDFKLCTTDGNGFRTLMAYPCYAANVPRVNRFSNPAITFNGSPTGVPSTDYFFAADNAKSLNNTVHTVAAFRTPEPAAPVAPSAPIGLSAIASGSAMISITWTDASTNETGFRVERAYDGITFLTRATLSANAVDYPDETVTAGQTYHYRVIATGDPSDSAPSNVATATTPEAVIPAAPTNLSASARSSSSIRLTWSDRSGNETGFEMERSVNGGSTFTPVVTTGANVTSYLNTGLASKKSYSYRARSITATDVSTWSNVATARTR